jgi:hypothetical protein
MFPETIPPLEGEGFLGLVKNRRRSFNQRTYNPKEGNARHQDTKPPRSTFHRVKIDIFKLAVLMFTIKDKDSFVSWCLGG